MLAHRRGLGLRDQRAPAAQLGEQAEVDVVGDRAGLEEALELALLGDVDDAVAHRGGRHEVAHRPAVEKHLAAVQEVALGDAGHHLEGLGAPRADQPEHAGDLALIDREGVVANHIGHRDVLDAQHHLAARAKLV